MIKKNLKILIITSIIILLPILAGLVLWNQLPDAIPIHWNFRGEVDNWTTKSFAVFATPLIMLMLQWICVAATLLDPKKQNHTEKILHIIFWIVPLMTIVISAIIYASALGNEAYVGTILSILLGVLFIIIGNYLPKCKQNYTIGIKIAWTLNNEENWNKTHRLAGWVWVVGGFIILLTGFLRLLWIILPVSLIMAIVPVIYSLILHKKGM